MFRIIFIVVLVLLAIPFFNKAKDYIGEKARKAEAIGTVAKKAFNYSKGEKEK
ncbi:MAG: hypothetical protein KA100_01540 [Rickettsiales bacterium]|nr:hypothetical protein [Rickettsiales bacterium]